MTVTVERFGQRLRGLIPITNLSSYWNFPYGGPLPVELLCCLLLTWSFLNDVPAWRNYPRRCQLSPHGGAARGNNRSRSLRMIDLQRIVPPSVARVGSRPPSSAAPPSFPPPPGFVPHPSVHQSDEADRILHHHQLQQQQRRRSRRQSRLALAERAEHCRAALDGDWPIQLFKSKKI